MSFDPATYYNLAQGLLSQAQKDGDGAHLRALISRAYYAALIVARDEAKVSSQGAGGHQRVISTYQKYGTSRDNGIARRLVALHALRLMADYEPKNDLTAKDARSALTQTSKVLKALQRLVP